MTKKNRLQSQKIKPVKKSVMEAKAIFLSYKGDALQYVVTHISCRNIAGTCCYRLSISVSNFCDKDVHME